MPKITYEKYQEMRKDTAVSDEELLSYSLIEPGEGGFDFRILPDPAKVDMSLEDREYESAMGIANRISRYRRQRKFRERRKNGVDLPVLVSEGDSWFQFPMLIDEVVDQLYNDYLIWSVGAAGDTAENMVGDNAEYKTALLKHRDSVKGFMFSAAGNDIIGENKTSKRPVLLDLIKDFNGDEQDIIGHINIDLLNQKMDFIRGAYQKVINTVRNIPEFKNLPIFIHGYDYVFPYRWENDPRDPFYVKNNAWLGEPLDKRGITNLKQRRGILIHLIDELYKVLEGLAGDSQQTGVWLVDCRGAMPNVSDWNDEIHGTSEGYKEVGARFRKVIAKALELN